MRPKATPCFPAAAIRTRLPGPNGESLTRLVCIMGRDGFQPGGKAYRFFQYVHLDSDTDFGFTKDGQAVTLRFAGMKPVAVIVRGRNLLRSAIVSICTGCRGSGWRTAILPKGQKRSSRP